MRGLLVVNPNATATTKRTRDVLIHALADQFHLRTVRTTHRNHAMELGSEAVRDNLDVVIVLGGDGTVNETVNGMMAARGTKGADELPMLGAIPGGSANVFTRSLGFPIDPVEATGVMVDSLRHERTRTVSLSHATAITKEGDALERWLTFNAGLGMDAEIIHAMERQRAEGKTATPTRYLMTSLRTFFMDVDRKRPAITLYTPTDGQINGVFLAIVQNASPWTYLGTLEVNPLPKVTWENDLGVWAVRRMRVIDGLRYTRRIIMKSGAGSTKKGLYVGNDLPSLRLTAQPPVPLQIDGEGLGDVVEASFTSHKRMLRVLVGSDDETEVDDDF